MRTVFVLGLIMLMAGWLGVAQAQSMSQREAFEEMARIYEAAGMYDLAAKARELGSSLDSDATPNGPTEVHRPQNEPQAAPSYRPTYQEPKQPREPRRPRSGEWGWESAK